MTNGLSPARRTDEHGGAPAPRAVMRWACRLYRREIVPAAAAATGSIVAPRESPELAGQVIE